MRGIQTAALTVILAACSNNATDFDAAQSYLKNKDYEHAIKLLRRSADAGNVRAQVQLAKFYEFGTNVPLDYPQANALLIKAVAKGDATAEALLGSNYYLGRGMDVDYKKAVELLEQAQQLKT